MVGEEHLKIFAVAFYEGQSKLLYVRQAHMLRDARKDSSDLWAAVSKLQFELP